jgi:hypothetical protein
MTATTTTPAGDAEPTISEILADPIVEAMMEADRVDRYALAALLGEVAQARRTAAAD